MRIIIVFFLSVLLFSCGDSNNKDIISNEEVQKIESIVMKSQAILGKNLMRKITKSGTVAALEFCNVNALPLLDSMSTVLNVDIKRVSDQNRNNNNCANAKELEFIIKCKELLNLGQKIKPLIEKKNNVVSAYFPIITNGMCLQCHGESEKINIATSQRLNVLYPNDKAIGYSENQLRGIWVVSY